MDSKAVPRTPRHQGGMVPPHGRVFSFRALSKRRIGVCAVLALLVALCMSLDMGYAPKEPQAPTMLALVQQFCKAFPTPDSAPQMFLQSFALFFLFAFGLHREPLRRHWPVVGLSLFLGFSMVCGWTLDHGMEIGVLFKEPVQLVKAACSFAAWGLVGYASLTLTFRMLDRAIDDGVTPWMQAGEGEGPRRGMLALACVAMDAHPAFVPMLVLAISWLPAFLGYLPGLFMGDTAAQVCMWYGLPHNRLAGTTLIDPAVTMTTHHPVLHTAFVGLCVDVGRGLLGSVNAGIAMYSSVQWLSCLGALGYAFIAAKRLGVSAQWRIAVLAFFALCPWYPTYAVLVTKDAFFAVCLLLFGLHLLQARREMSGDGTLSRKRLVLIILFGLLASLLRNGALLYVVGGFAAVLLMRAAGGKHARRQLAACLAIVVVVVCGFNQGFVPAMHIAPGSKAEMLSVPFQQTARYVKEHPGDVSADERNAIDAIVGYEGLALRYDPLKSDPVKDYAAAICKDADASQWADYFRAWAAMGLRHPGCYLEATANNYYGYFYVSTHNNQLYRVKRSDEQMERVNAATGLDFHRIDAPAPRALADLYGAYSYIFKRVPLVSLPLNAAFWCWALLVATAYALRKRWRDAAVPLVMLWLVMLVFLAGPCNGANYTRYVYPIAFALPALGLLVAPARRAEV